MGGIRSKKLGIIGGTFDPIHYGHLLIAQSAVEEFALDGALFLPTGKSPHKSADRVTAPKLRCDMVRIAIQNNPEFQISLLEAENEEINYTCQTLQKLRRIYPDTDFYFIMGEDSLDDFSGWKKPEEICRLSSILVAVRSMDKTEINTKVETFAKKYAADVHLLHSPNCSISSGEIRDRIKHGKSVRYMLPEEVEVFIRQNFLYGTGE